MCPVERIGKLCIDVAPDSKIAVISETQCIGCGICVKKCPFAAIQIINLPSNLSKEVTHRYGPNSFKLHRLPFPRPGEVLGLVGTNGIGKSTALKILAGKCKPNLGNFSAPPDWKEVIEHFRGSELQNYFTKVLEENLKVLIKPQYVDMIPRQASVKGLSVRVMLEKKNERRNMEEVVEKFDLTKLLDRNIEDLSGGELQRFACALTCVQKGDVFMFDEPSSYLDVKQRLKTAIAIRELLTSTNYVLCVEHDLAVLDYLSDYICCLYGVPGAYGVVTFPSGVREGINQFLDGFIASENLRFRETALSFRMMEKADENERVRRDFKRDYPRMVKKLGEFELTVEPGAFTDSEIVVLLGENGTGTYFFYINYSSHVLLFL